MYRLFVKPFESKKKKRALRNVSQNRGCGSFSPHYSLWNLFIRAQLAVVLPDRTLIPLPLLLYFVVVVRVKFYVEERMMKMSRKHSKCCDHYHSLP